MRKKKLWKKHCALGMAIVLASGNAVTPALADNTAVQVDNDTENDNKAENLDFETKDDETDHPDKGDSEGDNNKEQTKIPPDPTRQMKKSPKQKMRIKTQDLTMRQKMMK